MLETQLAQLAAVVPSSVQGKIPKKPEDPIEGFRLVNTQFTNPWPNSVWVHKLDSPFSVKRDDPGLPTITYQIRP